MCVYIGRPGDLVKYRSEKDWARRASVCIYRYTRRLGESTGQRKTEHGEQVCVYIGRPGYLVKVHVRERLSMESKCVYI